MFTFDPAGVALVALLIALYARAVTVLRWRGWTVSGKQQALFYGGAGLLAVALLGPPDTLSDDLLSAHMGQHLLLADIALRASPITSPDELPGACSTTLAA